MGNRVSHHSMDTSASKISSQNTGSIDCAAGQSAWTKRKPQHTSQETLR